MAIEKIFLLHLSAHWGDLIEQIKKSVIYTLIESNLRDVFSPQSPRSFWPAVGIKSSGRTRFSEYTLSICFVFQPIRFARFDKKPVNREPLVLDQARALDPCHRPEGSWALGSRMS